MTQLNAENEDIGLEFKERKLISIIIPAYNVTPLLYNCLESLKQTGHDGYDLETIIINANGSFAENCNRGIGIAKGEYILLLNDDTQVIQKEWLTLLVKWMDDHPKCGAVSPRMVFPDGRIQFSGMIFHSNYEGGHYGFGWNNDDPRVAEPRQYQATTFGCVLLRKEALLDIIEFYGPRTEYIREKSEGILDENYKIGGFEDVDACFRLKLKGWEIWYLPYSVLLHAESQTFKSIDQDRRWSAFMQNRLYYHKKWDKYFSNGTFIVDDVLYDGAKL